MHESIKHKERILMFLNKIHFLIFKSDMGPGTKNFAKNIGYTTLGNIFYTIFLFSVNIFAVRMLGPDNYGKYFLVLSLSNLLFVPMSFGIPQSLQKYLPEKNEDPFYKESLISTSFWSVLIIGVIFFMLYLVLKKYLSSFLAVSSDVFVLALIISFITVFRTLGFSVVRGLLQFKKQAIIEIVYAAVIFVAFFVLYFIFPEKNYKIYVFAVAAGLFSVFISTFLGNYRILSWKFFNKKILGKLLYYGTIVLFGSLFWSLITNTDRFFINKFLDVTSVGVYAVYLAASTTIIGRSLSLFLNVFFPTVSGIENKIEINKKINKATLIFFFPAIFVNCFVIYLMFIFYGSHYPFYWSWALLFSLSAVINAYTQIKLNLIQAEGLYAAVHVGRYSFICVIISLLFNLLLIPYIGILGAVITLIIVNIFFLYYSRVFFKKTT